MCMPIVVLKNEYDIMELYMYIATWQILHCNLMLYFHIYNYSCK